MALTTAELHRPSPAQELFALLSTLEPKDQLEFQALMAQANKAKTQAKKGLNAGVGDLVRSYIIEGFTNKEILTLVHEHYGNDNTTYACVAWYRNDMKSKGLI